MGGLNVRLCDGRRKRGKEGRKVKERKGVKEKKDGEGKKGIV